jgi:3-deoxy-D-manno-octulosonate 8-phosphate phosphatase KdsC-like HAD superfamily phosphatase
MVASAERQRAVRLLMALWDGALTKGKLIEKVKKSGEVAKDYHPIID